MLFQKKLSKTNTISASVRESASRIRMDQASFVRHLDRTGCISLQLDQRIGVAR